MIPSSGPLDSLLATIVLATLAIGLPIVTVLSIRFLWDRRLNLGRSKELEKLIWQLHRIASALEHQMNLSFPPVQPGTEEPRDRVFRQQPAVQSQAAAPNAAVPPAPQAGARESGTPQPAPPQATVPAPGPRKPSSEGAQHARVNSMFGFDK
jgi:hypothetical protein